MPSIESADKCVCCCEFIVTEFIAIKLQDFVLAVVYELLESIVFQLMHSLCGGIGL